MVDGLFSPQTAGDERFALRISVGIDVMLVEVLPREAFLRFNSPSDLPGRLEHGETVLGRDLFLSLDVATRTELLCRNVFL